MTSLTICERCNAPIKWLTDKMAWGTTTDPASGKKWGRKWDLACMVNGRLLGAHHPVEVQLEKWLQK